MQLGYNEHLLSSHREQWLADMRFINKAYSAPVVPTAVQTAAEVRTCVLQNLIPGSFVHHVLF